MKVKNKKINTPIQCQNFISKSISPIHPRLLIFSQPISCCHLSQQISKLQEFTTKTSPFLYLSQNHHLITIKIFNLKKKKNQEILSEKSYFYNSILKKIEKFSFQPSKAPPYLSKTKSIGHRQPQM